MSKVVHLSQAVKKRTATVSKFAPLHADLPEAIAAMRPALPLYVLWPDRLSDIARDFCAAFPGETMYAVKTNPHEKVLRALWKGGVKSYDVASIEEVRLVRKILPKAELYFMHPVKAPEAVREAYFTYGVRHFVLDCEDELYKILRETDLASDLRLYVRLTLPKNEAASIDFSCKFGATPTAAADLLKKCRPVAERLGLCFHVGTQASDPNAYARAVSVAADVIQSADVTVDCLDVGGGFPVSYPGETVCGRDVYIKALRDRLNAEGLCHLPLLAEPGRALVAEGGALVVRVELRKGDTLYINDGTYGGLFDAGPLLGQRYPVQAHRPGGSFDTAFADFRMAGPTCDSLDMMAGPFLLPADIRMGDWIEIGNLGAYSQGMRSNFNGFGHADTLCLLDSDKDPKDTKRKKR